MTPSTAFAPVGPLTSPTEGEPALHYHRCRWCHSAMPAGALLCTVCGSADLTTELSAGTGSVRRLLRPTRRGLYPGRPYLVALDEGFTVQAGVIGGLPGAVPVGARVRLAVRDDDGRLLTFRLCATS
ncbi:hypothetical protein AB0D08_34840 [Kitasatospora sp. NPDC048540]|uniref:Zn-ribbon domain-containing OB-fold protein n=1 Tax=unclassified Kitasatospora TaxID=2633591 RepID=UPI000691D39B|nr:hypothetical protein [Kitasatospora sp. MBT63]